MKWNSSFSLSTKIIMLFLASLFLILASFYVMEQVIIQEIINYHTEAKLIAFQTAFRNSINSDGNALVVGLEGINQNPDFAELYLSGNRTGLYRAVLPYYQVLARQTNISHFYFIDSNGKIFLRVHLPEDFGDNITRNTFKIARSTGGTGMGLEMGTNMGFTLRVVVPLKKDNNTIAYIEFGKDTDNLLREVVSKESGEATFFVNKDYIEPIFWSNYIKTANVRDRWNDFDDYVSFSSTFPDSYFLSGSYPKACIDPDAEDKTVLVSKIIRYENNTYRCGSFPVYDASGQSVGMVVVHLDITEQNQHLEAGNYQIYLSLFLICLLLSAIFWFINRRFLRPLEQLKKAAIELGKGNFMFRTNLKSNDEFQELGSVMDDAIIALGKLDDEKKQVDRAKTQFLSITSHELRSPMTPMKAQLQMLNEGYFGELKPKQKEATEIIIRNADRLDKIIVDFLEVSRIEAARIQFSFKQFSPLELLNEVVTYMKGYMPEKKISFKLNFNENLPKEIEADPDRVSQVLRNLISNAIKFSNENGEIEVGAQLADTKDKILLWVRDNGAGIPLTEQNKIFEPFFQVDKTFSRKVGGTGLGLAICRGIVQSQGGDIWFKSHPGKGTVFYFTIPMIPVKNIKPIKLLFSSGEDTERRLKEVFIRYLGPIGGKEFDDLKASSGTSSRILIRYVETLFMQGVLSEKETKKFISDLTDISGQNR